MLNVELKELDSYVTTAIYTYNNIADIFSLRKGICPGIE